MVTIRIPVIGSLTPSVFSVIGSYDPTSAIPSEWKLKIGLESAGEIRLQAVCNGLLSAVPPDEVLGMEYRTIGLDEVTRPTVSRLYLQPDPDVMIELQSKLAGANLGAAVKWFVYENVSEAVLSQALSIPLQSNSVLATAFPNQQDQQMAFLLGEVAVHVTVGQFIGSASTENATVAGNRRIEFGVHTSVGYVDPIPFFNTVAEDIDAVADANAEALEALVGSLWPFVSAAGAEDLINEAAAKLYPNAVLQEAFTRLSVASRTEQWRQVADGQKEQYLEGLNRNATTGTNQYFCFNRDEMINPFQLEAIAEFFIFWNDPGTTSQPPAIEDFAALKTVDFGNGDLHIVLIDPFNHDTLGAPNLPAPEWRLSPYKITGHACDPTTVVGADNTLTPDQFNGVLFVVHKGMVQGWYRWSSYSSHKWEDDAQAHCDYASSIPGNIKYNLRSRVSPVRAINYCFAVWYGGSDQSILATRTRTQTDYEEDAWAPGKFYYRSAIPVDGDGKVWVLIHFGHTEHDLLTPIDQPSDPENYFKYSGSAGCIVSPSFYLFREKLIDSYLAEGGTDRISNIKSIGSATNHDDSLRLFDSSSGFLSRQLMQDSWDSAISGTFWLIRPDEPSTK